jgi:hypothetical protein
MKTLVLGGYGNFGARICRALAADAGIELLIGGRDLERATAFAQSLGGGARGVRVDAGRPISRKVWGTWASISSSTPPARSRTRTTACRRPWRRPARTTSTWRMAAASSATFPPRWMPSSACGADGRCRRQHRAGALVGGGRPSRGGLARRPQHRHLHRARARRAARRGHARGRARLLRRADPRLAATADGPSSPAGRTHREGAVRAHAAASGSAVRHPRSRTLSGALCGCAVGHVPRGARSRHRAAGLRLHGVHAPRGPAACAAEAGHRCCIPRAACSMRSAPRWAAWWCGSKASMRKVPQRAAPGTSRPTTTMAPRFPAWPRSCWPAGSRAATQLPVGAHACAGLLTLPEFEPEFARWGMVTDVIDETSPAP